MAIVRMRCVKCLMPDTYPGIRFRKDGVCNHCQEYRDPELLGEESLLNRLSPRKRYGYDCIVGISGGRDSCYVAYLAKKRFKLKALAVFYDSPFYCELARRNVRNVCDKLEIDLITVRSKNNLEYNILRNHLTSVSATGKSWGQCIFCHYGIDAVLYNTAKERNIQYILSGFTKHERMGSTNRTKMLSRNVMKLLKHDLLQFIFYQSKAYWLLIDQRRQFRMPSNSILSVYRRAKAPCDGPHKLEVFDYIHWNYREIEKVLTEKVGWTKPDSSISWGYDCVLEPLLSYTYRKELGVSTVGIYLSNLIRLGQIEREEALEIMEKCEDEDSVRGKIESVFDYLRIPKSRQAKFFSTV